MADEGIGSKVQLLGSKEYKAALSDIGRQLTVLNSSMDASQSAFSGTDKSIESQRDKMSRLQGVYDAHAQKVALISQQLEAAKEKYGDNSKEADNYQIALNRAQTAMNKVGRELDATSGELDQMEAASKEAAQAQDGTAASADDVAKAAQKEGRELNAAGTAAEASGGKHDRLKGILSGLAAGLAAVTAAAAAAAGKLGKEVIESYGALEQNLGGSEAVFGEHAARIQKTGENAYKNMGATQSEYLATANKMGALFQGSGMSQARSLEITEKAMQRAADMASVMGIDTASALESVAGAAKGNYTMIKCQSAA